MIHTIETWHTIFMMHSTKKTPLFIHFYIFHNHLSNIVTKEPLSGYLMVICIKNCGLRSFRLQKANLLSQISIGSQILSLMQMFAIKKKNSLTLKPNTYPKTPTRLCPLSSTPPRSPYPLKCYRHNGWCYKGSFSLIYM